MKIAFLYKGNIQERYANILSLLKNIAALIQLGHDPILLLPKRSLTTKKVQAYVQQACEFYDVKCSPPTILIPSTYQYFGRSFGILAALATVFNKFDLVWSRDIYGAYTAAWLGLPTVFEHHTALSPKFQKLVKKVQHKKNFKGIIAISNAHKNLLISYGIRSDKIHMAHSGIDTLLQADNTTQQEILNANEKLIMYAGSFYQGRGIETIIEVAKILPNYQFICIGGTHEQVAHYESVTTQSNNLIFLPKMKRTTLLSYLQAADVLIAPYTHDSRSVSGDNIALYQSPLKLIEYMAVGKPIVTSRLGAIPEIITDQHNGILVTPDHTTAYAEAIQLLINDKNLATQLGENARTEAKKYTWDRRVSDILTFAMPQPVHT